MPERDEKPLDRRQFFRRGLGELLKPLAGALEPLTKTLGEIERLDRGTKPAAGLALPGPAAASTRPATLPLDLWLRPPGAGREADFANKCSRCGVCVRVCPAECIKLEDGQSLAAAPADDAIAAKRPAASGAGGGLPYIDANARACVMCDSLACMNECPTGALELLPRAEIDMGTAVWRDATCIRHTADDDCTRCVDICPMGTAAIEIEENDVVIHPRHCTGCGMCQQVCPTEPKSVLVIPKSAKERPAV